MFHQNKNEQIEELRAENAQLRSALADARAIIEYITMMCDIPMSEEEE